MKKIFLVLSMFCGSLYAWPSLEDIKLSHETRSFLNKAGGYSALGVTAGIATSHAAPYVFILSGGMFGVVPLQLYTHHHNLLQMASEVSAVLGLKSLISDNTFIKSNLPYAAMSVFPLLFKNLNFNDAYLTTEYFSLRMQVVAGLLAASYANYLNALETDKRPEGEQGDVRVISGSSTLHNATKLGAVYLGALGAQFVLVKTFFTALNTLLGAE